VGSPISNIDWVVTYTHAAFAPSKCRGIGTCNSLATLAVPKLNNVSDFFTVYVGICTRHGTGQRSLLSCEHCSHQYALRGYFALLESPRCWTLRISEQSTLLDTAHY